MESYVYSVSFDHETCPHLVTFPEFKLLEVTRLFDTKLSTDCSEAESGYKASTDFTLK